MYPLKQSTALDVLFFAYDANGDPVTDLVTGDWTKSISKGGSTTINAMTVTVTEASLGWYGITLSSSHTDTLGILSLSFSAPGTKQINLQFRVHARLEDDLAYPNVSGRGIDVDATGGVEITADQNVNVNKWLTVTPDALSSGKVPADIKLWLTAAPDALSSGKVPSDVKLWLAAAPAALTTNGYVQSMLLRWLTDNAGGTPNALISNRVDANAQVVGDKTGYALTSGEEDTIADKVWDEARAGHVTAGSFGQGVASVQGSVTGSVASVTGSVGSVAAGGITAASIATGAVDADALAVDALAAIASAVFAFVLEDSKTFAEFMRIILAALAGVSDGGTTTTIHFKARNGTTNRITATVDTATGNRTAIVLNGS